MKARIIFYCVAIAVLLATLAAIPSHATERRDPLLNQDVAQSLGSGHDSAAKPAQNGRHGKKPSPAHHPLAQGVKDKAATSKNGQSGNGQTSK